MSDRTHFFDRPRNVRRMLHGLYACCALLLLLDFIIHRHVEHDWEALWGFYPLYGFIGCVLLVLIAKWMRGFLMRGEDYYHSESAAGERYRKAAGTKGDE